MKRTYHFLSCILLSAIIVSCSKSNESDLTETPPPTNNCDTVNMKFTTNIKPILQGSCYGCHSNANSASGSGVKLEDHADVKAHADDGDLLGVITHAQGYPAMPQGGAKLSDCNINKIKAWINQGAQNN